MSEIDARIPEGFITTHRYGIKVMESRAVVRLTKPAPEIVIETVKKLNNVAIRKGQMLVKKRRCWHVCMPKDLQKYKLLAVANKDAPKGTSGTVEVARFV